MEPGPHGFARVKEYCGVCKAMVLQERLPKGRGIAALAIVRQAGAENLPTDLDDSDAERLQDDALHQSSGSPIESIPGLAVSAPAGLGHLHPELT